MPHILPTVDAAGKLCLTPAQDASMLGEYEAKEVGYAVGDSGGFRGWMRASCGDGSGGSSTSGENFGSNGQIPS